MMESRTEVELFEAFTLQEIAERREVQGSIKVDFSCGGPDFEKYNFKR